MLTRSLALVVVAAVVVAAGADAARQRAAACPAPKPLPAGMKKPAPGASATQLANFLLALPQRKPCDLGLFTSEFQPGPWPGLYPSGPPMQPLPMTTPTEARARSQVAAFFQGSPRRAAALALFDRGTVEAKVPDPAIRAALVLLVGTAGEPAIQHFLRSPSYVSPRFGGLGVQQLGRASIRYSDRKIEIILNARHMAEHPALLSSTLLHEILHHDPAVAGYPEEIILNWVSAVVHLQLVARHPALARSRTELSRYLNDSVLTIVNSRPRGSPRIAILVPRGAGVAPGSPKDAPDFWTFVHRVYEQNPTSSAQVAPAPPAFRAIVQALLARGAAPAKPQYSRKTAALFSKMNDTWLSPVDRLRVSVLLGLVSVEEIVRYTGLTRSKAIATFRLGPILAVS